MHDRLYCHTPAESEDGLSTYDEAHVNDCGQCQDQLADGPQPHHAELCHTWIGPGDPPVQCPHAQAQDGPFCDHHLTYLATRYIHPSARGSAGQPAARQGVPWPRFLSAPDAAQHGHPEA